MADHRRSWRRIYLEYEPTATELASVRLPRLFTPALTTATQRHPATGRYQAAAHLTSQLSTPLAATISMVATKAFPSDRVRRSRLSALRPWQQPAGSAPRQPPPAPPFPTARPPRGGPWRSRGRRRPPGMRPQLRDERAIQRCTRRSTTVNPSTTPDPAYPAARYCWSGSPTTQRAACDADHPTPAAIPCSHWDQLRHHGVASGHLLARGGDDLAEPINGANCRAVTNPQPHASVSLR